MLDAPGTDTGAEALVPTESNCCARKTGHRMSFLDLPVEIIQTIYSFFDDPATLRACCLSCKTLDRASRNTHVHRVMFENVFDHQSLDEAQHYAYQSEMKRRWQLLRPTTTDSYVDRLTTIHNMLLEMESSLDDVGKNIRHLQRARVGDLLDDHVADRSFITNLRASAQPLLYKVMFLMLCSLVGPLSEWEIKYAHQTPQGLLQALDPDLGIVLFTYEDLFYSHVSRLTSPGKLAAQIICDTPPVDFAGAEHYSTPNWQIFAAAMKFVLHHKHTTFKTRILEEEIPRPWAILHPDTTNAPGLGGSAWTGIYLYLDYETFQWVASEQPEGSVNAVYSDGPQTCHIHLHDDGRVTGDGKGAWSRTYGTEFTLHGTWTRIRGCPIGFKRVAFRKRYRSEFDGGRSCWLYDGIMVPGTNGGMFIGRWKDDTEQHAGEYAVQGPFVFMPALTD